MVWPRPNPALPLHHRRRRSRPRIRHRRRVLPRADLLLRRQRPGCLRCIGFNGSPGIDADFLGLIHRQEHTVRIGIGRRLDNPTSYEIGPARRGREHRRRADQFRYLRQRRYQRWPQSTATSENPAATTRSTPPTPQPNRHLKRRLRRAPTAHPPRRRAPATRAGTTRRRGRRR